MQIESDNEVARTVSLAVEEDDGQEREMPGKCE